MHLERRGVNEKTRPDKVLVLVMIAQHMAHVLAKKAFDTFPEFLDPIDILLCHPPGAVAASGGRGLNFFIRFLTAKFHETSVIKSFTRGKAFIGSIVIGRSRGRSLRRVMHINFGMPFTSAEQEPHLPALQFQRQARSFA
jgi:hypothetical protein